MSVSIVPVHTSWLCVLWNYVSVILLSLIFQCRRRSESERELTALQKKIFNCPVRILFFLVLFWFMCAFYSMKIKWMLPWWSLTEINLHKMNLMKVTSRAYICCPSWSSHRSYSLFILWQHAINCSIYMHLVHCQLIHRVLMFVCSGSTWGKPFLSQTAGCGSP